MLTHPRWPLSLHEAFELLAGPFGPSSHDQGVVLGGALVRYDAGVVISFRQLSRSRISPSEQVGEHHGGAGGILASGDSGGIRAGATDGGGELGRVVLHPLASSVSASSASISNRSFFLGIGSRLLLRRGASLFFLPGAALADHFRQPVTAVSLSCCLSGIRSLH